MSVCRLFEVIIVREWCISITVSQSVFTFRFHVPCGKHKTRPTHLRWRPDPPDTASPSSNIDFNLSSFSSRLFIHQWKFHVKISSWGGETESYLLLLVLSDWCLVMSGPAWHDGYLLLSLESWSVVTTIPCPTFTPRFWSLPSPTWSATLSTRSAVMPLLVLQHLVLTLAEPCFSMLEFLYTLDPRPRSSLRLLALSSVWPVSCPTVRRRPCLWTSSSFPTLPSTSRTTASTSVVRN